MKKLFTLLLLFAGVLSAQTSQIRRTSTLPNPLKGHIRYHNTVDSLVYGNGFSWNTIATTAQIPTNFVAWNTETALGIRDYYDKIDVNRLTSRAQLALLFQALKYDVIVNLQNNTIDPNNIATTGIYPIVKKYIIYVKTGVNLGGINELASGYDANVLSAVDAEKYLKLYLLYLPSESYRNLWDTYNVGGDNSILYQQIGASFDAISSELS